METKPREMCALLIGVNQYMSPTIPNLKGCVNDANAVEDLLRNHFQVPAMHIKKLINQEATNEAIQGAFRGHLIASAQAWTPREIGSSPEIIFYFSGHGSQALDSTEKEPDGLNETIVPYDSRTEGKYDIKDWELGQLIQELYPYTTNITVILDCCHSGSGTRDIQIARGCDPDRRPQPFHRPFAGSMRSLTETNWRQDNRHVLLAGCRDKELAYEYPVERSQGFLYHGALTYFLLTEILQMTRTRDLTYRELHERVRHQVNSVYRGQTPQCEGDRDRVVFGGIRPAQEHLYTVVSIEDSGVWLDAGIAHGLSEESLLHVYTPKIRTLANVGPPLATLRVAEVGAVRSFCTIADGSVSVPLHARVATYRMYQPNMRRRVGLHGASNQLHKDITARLSANDISNYCEIVENLDVAEFIVGLIENRIHILDSSGIPLVTPYAVNDVNSLGQDLIYLARYRNALDLRNRSPYAELAGAISLEVKRLEFDRMSGEPIALPIEASANNRIVVDSGQRLVLEIANRSDIPLYLALFDFSYDWSIQLLYPRVPGAHEPLKPGRAYSLGLSRQRREQIAPFLPSTVTEVLQIVKVIATVDEADFEILQQPALKTPYTPPSRSVRSRTVGYSGLDRLMLEAMLGRSARTLTPPPATVADEWVTEQIEFYLKQAVKQ